ncbi:MAG: MBL fold metallo-hydrolase [Candidatus Hodarchaeota archaeon]
MPEPVYGITSCVVFELGETIIPPRGVIEEFLAPFRESGIKFTLRYLFEDKSLEEELKKFHLGKKQALREWEQSKYPRFTDVGATEQLSILPLIDWHTSQDTLRTELGVSYLIRTDENVILFDLGLNPRQEHPSPLLLNMKQLGIEIRDVDTIVISHNHGDHTGGNKWSKKKTFSLSGTQLDISHVTVYTPVPMKYPGLKPIHTKDPWVVGKGVATTGSIANAMFFVSSGLVHEQALAVNVKNKGIVLIVGCGHQGLSKLLNRTARLFEEPLFGIIGGLHYAVEGGPIDIAGMSPHSYFGTGKVPWESITKDELQANIALLKKLDPKIVALSPHDSSPLSISKFNESFGAAYRRLRVGEEIYV